MPDAPMRCRQCAYDLRGLDAPRCPECGRSFDPERPRTYLSAPVSGRRALVFALIGAALAVLPLGYAALADRGVVRHGPDALMVAVLPALMITGFAIAWHACALSVPALLGRRPWRVHPKANVVAFVLGAVVLTVPAFALGRALLRLLH